MNKTYKYYNLENVIDSGSVFQYNKTVDHNGTIERRSF